MPFVQLPCLIPVDESGPLTIWLVHEPYSFRSEKFFPGKLYVAPGNYLTNLASVPRAPLIWISFGARANAASALHDFLYDEGMRLKLIDNREEADLIFLEAMLCTGVDERSAYSMYGGVVNYGETHFHYA